ncbi:FERM, RhoGEF and pleckstrin domain-containing protein 2 FERM domain including [Collichthys lucidus]|uniref:FERM, RhoGEF and pleckstrin domain-containing protein 2 FERM domain including n=1 Tax=Collichthys lucidus TaxID=240159 RepID=A0A4U5UJ24_COLLU|nr:FERM, RhoGEF and pleckstrin domain-containing protein 2 FERM domain including [Collichthys lucidus]
MGDIEGSYRVLQTPGTRLGAQFNAGISTLEPGQSLGGNMISGSKSHWRALQIRVQGLDDSQEFFDVDPKAFGQALLSDVFLRGNLIESDYFGLEFQNMQMNWVWLEPTKPIAKQVRRPANTLFRLSVKFFPPDPGQLQEEYTRYLFSLQMKRDLMEGRLFCTENTGALLASHLVQSEIGDYDDVADRDFLRTNKLLPYQEKVQEKIMELHRRHLGHTPAESDFQILEIARKLEMYGVRFHPAADREGTKINLAVSHMGLQVFQGNTKINTFNWSKIRKLSFKRKRFLIKLHPEVHGPHQDTLEFMMASRDQCKIFWKICVEYHSFFRLFDQPQPKSKAILFTRGSSFRYSGRTQKQLVEYVRENGAKRTPYQRRNSKIRMSARSIATDVPKQTLSFNDSLRAPGSPSSATVSFYPAHISSIHPRTEHQPQLQPLSALSQSPAPHQQHQLQHLQSPLQATRPPSPPMEEPLKAASPSHYAFQGAPSNQAAGHCSPLFVCVESGTSKSQPSKNGNEDNEHGGRRGTGCSLGGGGGKRKGVLTPEAFEAELLRTKQNPMFSMSNSPLHVTEEFIDDDPTEISFYGGGAEAFSFGLDDKVHQFDYVEGIRPHSLVNNRSECSSLDNLGLSSAGESMSVGYGGNDSSSLRLPGSDIQSEASSMVNFPAYSVRSESSSAVQFSDLVEQLEQLSYPPTATEGSGNGSSDSDSDWGSDSVLPPEQNLFYSNPLTGNSGIEGFLLQCHNLQALALADPSGSPHIKMCNVPVYFFGMFPANISVEKGLSLNEEDSVVDSPQLSPFNSKGPLCLSPSFQMSTLSLPGQAPSPLQSPILSEVGSTARLEEEEEGRRKRYPTDKAYFIAKEILTTERTYLKDLEVITVWFRSAVIKENAMPEGLMTLLFSNIDPIYEFHRGFLKELDQRLALWEGRSNAHVKGDYQRIGDVMLRNMCALKRLKKLETVYKEFELQKVCYLPLNTFLLKPIQRLMHYKLILERLCKHYSPTHRDHDDCKEALKEVADIATQLQSSLIRLENFQKLTELQRDLIGIENLTAPGRVEESENEWSVPHCFTIYSAQRTIVVAASSKVEMGKWIEDLNLAIDMAKKSQEKSSIFLDAGLGDHSNRSSDEVSLEQESEDDMNSSRTSLDKQTHHRANTTMHVCWHRNTSVSMSDHSLAVENQLSGYLLRKFKNSNGWQKLWVVFTNFCLFFYKTHQDDFPLASLPLLGYTVSTPEESDSIHKEYVFKLQFKSHVYFFRAESEYTFERWMEVIKSAASTTGRMSLLISKGGPLEINGN